MLVLLIERDDSFRKRISLMLREHGHQVVVIDEGADALKLLQEYIFDLIVTSFMAGQMRVVQFAIAAKTVQPRTPIIVTGGYFGANPTIPFIDAIVQAPVVLRDVEQAASALLGASEPRSGVHQPGYLRTVRRTARRLKKSGTET